MDQIKFSCLIDTTDSNCPMGVEIWLDESKIYDNEHVEHLVNFAHEFDNNETDHELRFVLKNKPTDYTQLDENNQIVKDALLLITDMAFDEIKLGYIVCEHAIYRHDGNGNSLLQDYKFYGSLGCNGTVSLKFTTPVYLWLLENM